MPQSAVKREVNNFSKGFNSDAGPLTFPDDHTLDELNYDILIDGTRRRRKGLELDQGSPLVNIDYNQNERVRSFKWNAAGDDTTVNLTVIQFGRSIRFFDDTDDGLVGPERAFSINLIDFKTAGASNAQVDAQLVDIVASRGRLVLVGAYIEPLNIRYIPADDAIEVEIIGIIERDLVGIEDGTPNSYMPATLTDAHKYNLFAEGWLETNITQFKTDTGFYPSRSQVHHLGYRRQIVTGIADIDGTKEFSSDKLLAELFQDAPAPYGHLKVSPFDTTFAFTGSTVSNPFLTVNNVALSATTPSAVVTVTLTTTAAHGLAPLDSIYFPLDFSMPTISYVRGDGSNGGVYLSGSYVVQATPTGTTFTVLQELPSDMTASVTDNVPFTCVAADGIVANPSGQTTDLRPSTCAFFAGRIWYAGINSGKLSTKIYFSQVVEDEAQYGKCYQVADPTDANISDLIATDGGTINIPEMGVCFRLQPYESGLLVYSFNGVWFIGPGERGYFSADSYSVRKVSEVGVDGAASMVIAETIPFYWGRNSIYRISRDTNTGFLVSVNVSIRRIDSFFNAISATAKNLVQAAYDPLLKKVYWLYPTAVLPGDPVNNGFNSVLIYDLKYDGFNKARLPLARAIVVDGEGNPIVPNKEVCASIFTARTPDPNNPGSALKFVYQNQDESFFGVMTADVPNDFLATGNGFEQEAYMITGYDTLGNPSRRKQPLYITVYSVKTETGYTLVGSDLVPIGESSTVMQTRFDWANHVNSGKWGPDQEVYRHARLYIPVDENDTFDNGETLVITRNKVRGRGRALHIKFSAGTGKHSHIAGWTTNYRVLTQE